MAACSRMTTFEALASEEKRSRVLAISSANDLRRQLSATMPQGETKPEDAIYGILTEAHGDGGVKVAMAALQKATSKFLREFVRADWGTALYDFHAALKKDRCDAQMEDRGESMKKGRDAHKRAALRTLNPPCSE